MSDRPVAELAVADRRPLRVAMIGQYGVPAAYGGVERVVEELGAKLVERGMQVTVYCSPIDPPAPATYRGMDLVVVRTLEGKFLAKLSQAFFATMRARRGDFDIVHFHAMGPCLFAPIIRWTSRSVAVSTIHSRDDKFAKWAGPARPLFKVAAWCAAKIPARVMVVSERLRADIAADFGIEAVVVPNGMAGVGQAGGVDELEQFGLEPGRYLLTVGRMVHEKATDDLVEAFGAVGGTHRLAIVGESAHTGDFAERVHEMAAADDRVVMCGPQFGPTLDALYRHAGGFVLPSRLEGMPVALLEAISYRLPVVVSDIPACVEVVGNDAPGQRVFPVGSIETLTKELTRLIDENETERLGAQALAPAIEARFSWDRAADLTRDVYADAIAGVDGATPRNRRSRTIT